MDDLPLMLAIVGICFAGSFVHLACGFGFSVVVMGVLTRLLPSFGEAAALANLLMLVVSLFYAVRLWRNIRWKVLVWPLIGYFPMSLLMTYVLDISPGVWLRIGLGVGLILLALYLIFLQKRFSVPSTPASGIIIGGAAGVLGGLFCMAGVPMALYLVSAGDKEEYLATSQGFFTVTTLVSAGMHGAFGFVTRTVGTAFAFSIVAVALGALLGRLVFKRVNQTALKRMIYGFMLLSGFYLIFF